MTPKKRPAKRSKAGKYPSSQRHATAAAALAEPLGYPPLVESLFPGDQIALVPDAFVASQYELLIELVGELLRPGMEPENITLLLTEEDCREHGPALRVALEAAGQAAVRLVVHRPSLRQDLAMLAVSTAGQAIAVNRQLVDADFVLLVQEVGAAQAESAGESAFFPRFADAETIQRHRTAGKGHGKQLTREMAAAIRELGAGLVLEYFRENGQLAFTARHADYT